MQFEPKPEVVPVRRRSPSLIFPTPIVSTSGFGWKLQCHFPLISLCETTLCLSSTMQVLIQSQEWILTEWEIKEVPILFHQAGATPVACVYSYRWFSWHLLCVVGPHALLKSRKIWNAPPCLFICDVFLGPWHSIYLFLNTTCSSYSVFGPISFPIGGMLQMEETEKTLLNMLVNNEVKNSKSLWCFYKIKKKKESLCERPYGENLLQWERCSGGYRNVKWIQADLNRLV